LDDQRLVEPEGPPRVRELLGISPSAGSAPGRVSRGQLHEDQEREDRDDYEDENRVEQPARDVPEHEFTVGSVIGWC
jgi:hypothetical protein